MSGIHQSLQSDTYGTFSGTGDGSSAANAGTSARQIKRRTGTTTNGVYWIKPAADLGQPATQVYCDMNTNGGGWMLVARSHPGASGGAFGWTAGPRGGVSTFTDAYNLGWKTKFYDFGDSFSEIIFGNRLNVNNNEWGPFIYKISMNSNQGRNLLTDDIQQSGAAYSVLKTTLSVYNSTVYPGMQQAIGFPISGTNASMYYLRDCCGFTGYGLQTYGMVTAYLNDTVTGDGGYWRYSGPWARQDNAVDGGGNFVQETGSAFGGGTWQAMIMVR